MYSRRRWPLPRRSQFFLTFSFSLFYLSVFFLKIMFAPQVALAPSLSQYTTKAKEASGKAKKILKSALLGDFVWQMQCNPLQVCFL
jgi:hypothetical protein